MCSSKKTKYFLDKNIQDFSLAFFGLGNRSVEMPVDLRHCKKRLALQFTTILFAQKGKKEKGILSLNA
jgi:hypothetical protein